MKPILEIEKISKKFRIAHELLPYLSLRERMVQMLSFRKTKSSEEFWALKDISFTVQAGDSVGIIGKNGAGKSTLLKILSRITPPSGGRIISRGRIASLLEVGTGFHPELTGRENIYLNGSILGMRQREIISKFDAIVDFSGVEKFLDTPLKHYSSGMQLRLAFAVSAFLEPEILVIDEVLAVGDAEFQKKCIGKLDEVSRSGRTILFVSHNLSVVRNHCNVGLVLKSGMMVKQGPVAECIDYYLGSMDSNTYGADSSVALFDPPAGNTMWINKIESRKNGQASSVFYTGDEISFKVNITCKQNLREPKIGLTFRNQEGMSILFTNNRFQLAEMDGTEFNGTSEITCNLGQIPLESGRYFVTFYLADDHKDHQVIENAMSFEVEQIDIWGRGQVPAKGVAPMWWPAKIHMKSVSKS